MRPVLLATTNPAKADKLRWVLEGIPLEPRTGQFPAPVESGASYLENARLKAVAASLGFAGLAIASDGGVQIPALGAAWNGLFTARAAREAATDEARARHLLTLMQGQKDRRIGWTEAVALADRGKLLASWQASGNEGVLTEEYDPANATPGFWVYSLWYYPQLGKRYVELSPEELEGVDHTWGRLKERVQAYFRGQTGTS